MKKIYLYSLLLLIVFSACSKKESDLNLEDFSVYPSYSNKNKLKTDEQYIAILYANLFQKAISAAKLNQMSDAIYSVGDKQLARELIVSSFMNDPSVKLPTNEAMRNDIDGFLNEAYKRFFVRNISEAEKTWFRNYIEENQDVSVEFVYAALALSNEYQFY